jgi:hypothetical protein
MTSQVSNHFAYNFDFPVIKQLWMYEYVIYDFFIFLTFHGEVGFSV